VAQNYQVQTTPTVLMFKDGKLADHVQGMISEADLKAKLTTLTPAK